MIKIFLKSILIGLGLLLIAPFALASTIDFSPTIVNTQPGKTFTVQVYVNPQSATYSAKVELKYPADLLQVSSFVINDDWMALKQSGYDANDTVNGILLKSGGYPGGITTKTLFGTVTFSTVKAGSAAISIGSNTIIPNSNNVNTLTTSPALTVAIVAPVVQQKLPPVQQQATPPVKSTTVSPKDNVIQEQEPVEEPEVEIQQIEELPSVTTATEQNELAQASLVTVLGNIITLGTNNWWFGLLTIIGLIAIIFYGYNIYQKRKKA